MYQIIAMLISLLITIVRTKGGISSVAVMCTGQSLRKATDCTCTSDEWKLRW